MAVDKIDPKVIFASEAPAQDIPAVFTNRTVGWGESRKNGGRPTIKQSNALQQETDLKILWLNENAVTPFDTSIDYPENAVTIKDGVFKILKLGVWELFLDKSSVGLSNVDNTSDLNKPVSTAIQTALNLKADKSTTYTKVEVNNALDLLKPPYLSSDVVDGNQTQDQINLFGGKKYDMPVGGYPLNSRVLLDNGDIVKSTIANNTNDPNSNMSGWVLTNNANQIIDSSLNLNQSEINELLKTKSDYTVWIKDFGAKLDGVTDDTTSFKAALQHLKDNGGGTLRLGRGKILLTSSIDMGNYCVLDSSLEPSYPLVAVNIDIIGEGLKSTTILWKGGTDGNGGYGTALLLRSKTLAGAETYYFGRVSDFNLDVFGLNIKKGHTGSWSITNRFTTIASALGGCNPVTGSLTAYPTAINKVDPAQGASCGIFARTIAPAQIKGIQFRGFAFGLWAGVGYATQVQSCAFRWNMCGMRFGDAITTTMPQDCIFEKNAVGVLYNVTSHVGLGSGCVVQGNYAGCDVLMHSWNRRVMFDHVYFEASVKGMVIRTDSSGQFRNSEVVLKDCTGVQLDVDIAAISEMYLENNHIQSTQFNATGTGLPDAAQHYAVRVKNNFSYDNTTAERRKMLWNDWNIPERFLYCEDTMQITGFDYPRIDTLSSGAKSSATKVQAGSATNDFTLKVPNARAACVLKLEGVACRYGDDLKDLLYFTCAVAVTRQLNGVAIAEVGAISSTLMATQATGISILSPAVVTAVVSGAADAVNTITIKASKAASGGNSAIQVIDAKLLTAVGTVQLNKA